MEHSDYLSRRVRLVKLSPVAAASARAAALVAAGKNIITLTSGEPDFDTPQPIKDAAIQALNEGDTKYTPTQGTLKLRQAVVSKYQRENSLTYSPDQIIISNGGKQVIYDAFNATLNDGEHVIIPAPYWPSFPDMVTINGGVPVLLKGKETDAFKISAEQLEQAITSKTKWLILNSPNNPSGAVYSEIELDALARVLRLHPQILILWDEMYEHIWFGDQKPVHLLHIAPDLSNRTLLVNGASKTFAMTGWRIGWGAGPKALIQAMGVVQSQVSSGPNSFSQAATVAALDGVDPHFAEKARQAYKKRAESIVFALNQINGLHAIAPRGSFFAYVSVKTLLGLEQPNGSVLKTDQDVVDWLLESAGVAVVAGEAYGVSPYFRISFAANDEALKEAAVRIQHAIALLKEPVPAGG